MNVIRLEGCAPTPLAHYLKAIGILRVVAQQVDADARGWWDGESFVLATKLTRERLVDFFLKDYSPMPPTSPWNKGSGFYGGDKALHPVEHSSAPRFSELREAVRAARDQLDELTAADRAVREIKEQSKRKNLSRSEREALRRNDDYKNRLAEAERLFKELKADLIPKLQRDWRGPQREWMDAALVLEDDGAPRFPALLGTGGNDGRLDFTNNFFQRLDDIFDLSAVDGVARAPAREWLEASLFGTLARGVLGVSVGQFSPAGAGGANSTAGPEGGSQLNPFDFLLMLEGSVAFVAAASRRLETSRASRATAPFVVAAHAGGYASASRSDESARGEQWMPLWSQPTTFPELKRLFADGRAQIGTKSARQPLDIARALVRLGTARGLTAFERFAYIERNGQANLAVPLGRFYASAVATPIVANLDDLEGWLPRLARESRSSEAPARLTAAEKRLTDALFQVTQHPNEASRWQQVLLCLADVEAVQVTGRGVEAGPIPRLRGEWIKAANDGSPTFRLAIAFAQQQGGFKPEHADLNGIRRHWLPLDGRRYATTGSGGQRKLSDRTDRVMRGRSGLDDAIAVVMRRLVEASQIGERRLPLDALRRFDSHPADIESFLRGEIDPDRVLYLARALMAIDGRAASLTGQGSLGGTHPDEGWLAIRLATLPWPLLKEVNIGTDPAIVRRLDAGDATTAFDLARRRLRAAGIRTSLRTIRISGDGEASRRWAAALAFPISNRTARRFATILDPNFMKEENS